MSELCEYCYKPAIKFEQTLARWNDEGIEHVAHWNCQLAVDYRCPQCQSYTGVKIPRGLPIYCEDCGWPDEDLGAEDSK